jgi:hypothetical protein
MIAPFEVNEIKTRDTKMRQNEPNELNKVIEEILLIPCRVTRGVKRSGNKTLAMFGHKAKIAERKPKTVMKLLAILIPSSLFCLLLATSTGCSSWGKSLSSSYASVDITNATPMEIRATTIGVFKDAEYQAYYGEDSWNWLFEREATRGESLAYNGIVATRYGQTTIVRVKTNLFDRGNGKYRLSCKAFIVTDAASFHGGYENALSGMRAGEFQDLLDKVAEDLKNKPPPVSK